MTKKEYLFFLCYMIRNFLTSEQMAGYNRQMHKKNRTLREGGRIKEILPLNKGYRYEETAELFHGVPSRKIGTGNVTALLKN